MNLKEITFKLFTNKNKTTMKNEKLSEVLGRDVNVGASLSAEDLTKIEAALNVPTETETETTETTAVVVESNEKEDKGASLVQLINQAVASAMSPISSQLTAMSERLEIVEGSAGAETETTPKVNGDVKTTLESWEDPNNPLNQKISNDLV